MHPPFEKPRFTYNFFADFVILKPFKECTPKSTQAFDTNWQFSTYAARQPQYFEEIVHFQRQMFSYRWDFQM